MLIDATSSSRKCFFPSPTKVVEILGHGLTVPWMFSQGSPNEAHSSLTLRSGSQSPSLPRDISMTKLKKVPELFFQYQLESRQYP